MKTNMSEFSLYAHVLAGRHFQPRERAVLEKLSDGAARTQEQVADMLKLPVHAVNGRFNKLEKKLGILEIVGKGKTRSGKPAGLYRIKTPTQPDLFGGVA